MLKNTTKTNDLALGATIRTRRKELGLTMQEVAEGAGLSVGFISQVERDITAPSLGSLASIARVLDTPLSRFLDQPQQVAETTRHDLRQAYAIPGAEMTYERLSNVFAGSRLHSVIVHEPPGHRLEPISHRGEEMFYMLAGSITVEIEGQSQTLRQGDSIHFDSTRIHSTWNHSDTTASILWCGTMDVFGDAPAPIHKSKADQ
jgi:transcriptional regulator with XRE-family HTH domain